MSIGPKKKSQCRTYVDCIDIPNGFGIHHHGVHSPFSIVPHNPALNGARIAAMFLGSRLTRTCLNLVLGTFKEIT